MRKKTTPLEAVYLVLAVVGLLGTWYYNTLYFLNTQDYSITTFIALTQTNFAAKSISVDISIVAIACIVWMIHEGRLKKVKRWWVCIPLTFLVALAFSFPLFLYLRERRINKLKTT